MFEMLEAGKEFSFEQRGAIVRQTEAEAVEVVSEKSYDSEDSLEE